MNACVKRLRERRTGLNTKGEWGAAVANDNVVDPLFDLEQRINAHHDAIANLMHLRNDCPENEQVCRQLEEGITSLRQLQSEYAEALQARYESRTDLPSREDPDDFKKAMALVEYYENHTSDDDPS